MQAAAIDSRTALEASLPPAGADSKDAVAQRRTMVDCQIRTFDVTDQRLIARLLVVPREHYVPDDVRHLAYSDVVFSLAPDGRSGPGRSLLPPLFLARMIQGARVRSSDRVLDVAPGGGYSSAVLAALAGKVTALEEPEQGAGLRRRLGATDPTVTVVEGALASGHAAGSPYDVILINGAVETGLDGLFAQLAENGRLVVIERSAVDPTGRAAKAICFEKHSGEIGRRYLFDAVAPVLPGFRQAAAFRF